MFIGSASVRAGWYDWTMVASTEDGTTWIRRLRKAAGSGEPVDLAPDFPEDESDPPDAGEGVSARELPAEDIRALLLEPDLVIDPRGLRVRGALVTGILDLDNAKLPCRLVFTHCRFENAPSFEQAILPGLVLEAVALPGLSLHSARLTGGANLTGLRSTGEVMAENIHIGGRLDLTGAKLDNPGGIALNLNGADIAGNTFLGGLESTGEVRATGAHVDGSLLLTGAKLKNPGWYALALDGAEISRGAQLSHLEAVGGVRALDVHIGGGLDLTEARLNSMYLGALNLDRADVAGNLILENLEAVGEVRALGAHIGGRLDLTMARLTSPEETALNLDGADVTGGVVLDNLVADGEVRAVGAHIGVKLSMFAARLNSKPRPALNLAGIDIKGNAFMVILQAHGDVMANRAHIDGQLHMGGAKLNAPDGCALCLSGAEITGNVVLAELEAAGHVEASFSHVAGALDLRRAKLDNPGGNALDLSAATLGILVLDDAFTAEGRTDLSHASIHVLSVGREKPAHGLPPLSGAQGWTLGTVLGFLRTDRKSARAWLDTIDTVPRTGGRKEFAAQPWKEIAKIYDQIGQPEDARRLRFWAARRTTRVAPWTSKLVRWPYATLVGYGYYPLIVLGWLAALWLTVLVMCCLHAQAFTPTDSRASTVTVTTNNRSDEVRVTGATAPPPNYPRFDAGLFAVDTAIPAAETGQANAWRVTENTWLPSVFAAVKGFAWLLTALLLAGITGILRKD
jgi:uncharacterized protein YjbI with pentapeptide repeats